MITKHPFRIRRVPGIDGLRGLAVIAVVIYHFFGEALPGGFVGVDLFFVLSGFLITSLLIRERAVTGRIDLKDFWLRRLRRIAPAAFFVLMVSIAAAGLVGGDPAVGLKAQFLGTVFFVNNWTQIAGAESYFADSGVQLLAHYWSLAVEEQFYVLWPLIVTILVGVGVTFRRLRLLSALGAAASLWAMLALYDPTADPTRVYYGTDTHAFGLLIGATLALMMTSASADAAADSWPQAGPSLKDYFGSSALAFLVATLPLIAMAAIMLTMPDTASFTYNGGLAIASLLGATLLFLVVREDNPVHAIFNGAPMRWFGKVSFSLYLWHWPIIVLIRELLERNGLIKYHDAAALVGVIAALALSAWSYRYVETPIRRNGYRATLATLVPRRTVKLSWSARLVPFGAVSLVALVAFAMATGPTMTRLEEQLALAVQQREAAHKAEAAELAKRFMPRGDQVSAIGDSVMLASAEALEAELPGIYIDAAVSRGYPAAPAIIEQMEAAGTLDPFVVLGLGINQSAAATGEKLLDEILDSLGKDRVIVLINPYGDRSWMPQSEKEVLEAAKKRDNVYVADWCHGVRDDVSLLRGDLIHPTPQGAQVYAAAVKEALRQYAENDKRIPARCGV
nr:acyltransferase family protein [Corynebacterium lactis]